MADIRDDLLAAVELWRARAEEAERQRDTLNADLARERQAREEAIRERDLECERGDKQAEHIVRSERLHTAVMAQRDALCVALNSALDLADEGWSYASNYFLRKWNFGERMAELRASAALVSTRKTLSSEDR